MKKITLILSIIAILVSTTNFIYDYINSVELVYVDVNKLLKDYKRTKKVREEFEYKATILQSNLDSIITNWKKELDDFKINKKTYSKKELLLKQELLSNKQQQINNYQQSIQQQIKKSDKESSQIVIDDINNYIEEFGKKKGYKIIFGASGSGSIMYAEDSTDLTDVILKELNTRFEGQ